MSQVAGVRPETFTVAIVNFRENIFQDVRLKEIRLHSEKLQHGWGHQSQSVLVLD
jgi:DNA-binding protein